MDQSKSSLSNDLFDDTVVEILSWLPVDSLLRFKSVSKSWFSLISNPKFAKLHLHHHHHSLTATAQLHNPTIISISKTHYSLKSMDKVVSSSSSSSSSSTALEKLEMVYPFPFPKHSFRIVGSCNGLICISMIPTHHVGRNGILCLWNPSTKEFKLLPSHGEDDAPFEFPPHYGNGRRVRKVASYGFGYDHVMEDYKVIASVQSFGTVSEDEMDEDMYHLASVQSFGTVSEDEMDEDMYHCEELKVYTLGTDSWRRIQGSPYKRELYRGLATWSHVNGALHWIAAQLSSLDLRILSFDIVEEVYREVPKPKSVDGRYEWELTVLRGCLCLYARKWLSTKQGYMMEVWMMMNYGVEESWTKLFNITNVVHSYLLKPAWFCRNDELLMEGVSKLVIYDPKHNEARVLKSPLKARVGLRFESEIYITSLVSLKSHKEIEKKN